MIPTIIADPRLIIDIEPSEIWHYQQPKRGDHIRVNRSGIYNHHGVYVSDEEVIHFTGTEDDSVLDWSKCEVIKSHLSQFLRGGQVEVKIYRDDELDDLYPVDYIVDYARACLGDAGYHLVFNNCEHFANMCTLGRFRSEQVERVLSGRLPFGKDYCMFGLGSIARAAVGAIKSFFGRGSSGGGGGGGSRSTSSTTYEPDKVKVAEIEADTKIRLAGMEQERIRLMKEAKLDILQYETECQVALEQAKAQGFAAMAQTIIAMQDKLNEVAEKRLLIIEKGSLQIVKEIECFYNELGDKIQADDDRYNTEKLPELLTLLEQYEEGSPAHTLYMKRIEADMTMQATYVTQQLEALSQRQTQIINGFLASKDRVVEQTGQITVGMLKQIEQQTLQLESTKSSIGDEIKQLPEVPTLAIEEKSSVE